MNPVLPDDLLMLQRSVRQFVEAALAPLAKQVEERDEIPRSAIDAMAEAGLFGVGHPEGWGGQGFGKLGYCVAVEQLARVNASFWNIVGGSSGLCGTAIAVGGPDEVRRRYLPQLLSARKIGAYALSEPGAGSDAGSLRTAARRDRDDYVISGAKTFITNAPIADLFVIFANAAPDKGSKGITAFVVERAAPGLEIGPNDEKMGLHGSTTAQLFFNDMRVPATQRVGDEGDGFKIALATLSDARAVRQADRGEPGDPVADRRRRDRDPRGQAHGVRRGVARRSRRAHHAARRDDQALRHRDARSGGRRRRADPRRHGLHARALDRACVPRRADRAHLRGHQRDPAPGHRGWPTCGRITDARRPGLWITG
ncbi:MAG: hypothetical protein E6H94_12405 [Chloroflexi bacterium]|nr:MAG: hypothetical protein E6H94_12405 [Chloroflexota bacterium]